MMSWLGLGDHNHAYTGSAHRFGFGSWMTFASPTLADTEVSTLRRKIGTTFQCCPLSVMMVTDLRLYLVMMP